jgi:prepilin-type processing-associated H-X9-DG protein
MGMGRSAEEENPEYVGGFGSAHQGGANFVMADGGVMFLTRSIDPIRFQNLGNRADGAMMGDAPGSLDW